MYYINTYLCLYFLYTSITDLILLQCDNIYVIRKINNKLSITMIYFRNKYQYDIMTLSAMTI